MNPFLAKPSPEALFIRLALQGLRPDASDPAGLVMAGKAITNWEALIALASRHGVSPWLLAALNRPDCGGLLPPESVNALRDDACVSAIMSLSLDRLLEQVLVRLENEGVPALVLKGLTIAGRYYPDPALRPYGDADILVPLELASRVQEIMRSLDFVPVDADLAEDALSSRAAASAGMPLETAYVETDSGLKVDVHYDHLQIGLRPKSLNGLWSRSEAFSIGAACSRVPGLTDLCLLLLVHLHKHGFERLIWFKDLDLLLRSHGAEIDWALMASIARAEGALSSLRLGLRLLQELFGTPLTESAMTALGLHYRGPVARLLWRSRDVLSLETRPLRFRRSVQFLPREGLRGIVPSFFLMGRRRDKLVTLAHRFFHGKRFIFP